MHGAMDPSPTQIFCVAVAWYRTGCRLPGCVRGLGWLPLPDLVSVWLPAPWPLPGRVCGLVSV